MSELWPSLIPFLLTDVLNPVLFTFMVFAAGGNRPVLHSSLMLLGHTVAYFSLGIVLALGMDAIMERLSQPQTIDFVIELVLGVILLWLALKSRQDTGRRPDDDMGALTGWGAFGIGATINFIGIPFAVPYFAVLGQILKTDLTAWQATGVLLGYNIAYTVPFLMVPLLVLAMGDASRPVLTRINAVLERAGGILMPLLLGLIGLALLADGLSFFIRGVSLF